MEGRGIILDSDVLIWWLRGREDVVRRMKELVEGGYKLYTTPVNVAEIWAGVRAGEERKVERMFEIIEVVKLDVEVGRMAGEYLSRYGKSHGVELGDALIAGCVERYGLSLWTFNMRHYPMVRRFV